MTDLHFSHSALKKLSNQNTLTLRYSYRQKLQKHVQQQQQEHKRIFDRSYEMILQQ